MIRTGVLRRRWTPRENDQIIGLIVREFSNTEIARTLGRTLSGLEQHLVKAKILQKVRRVLAAQSLKGAKRR